MKVHVATSLLVFLGLGSLAGCSTLLTPDESLLPLAEDAEWGYVEHAEGGSPKRYTYRVRGRPWRKMADGATCRQVYWEDDATGQDWGLKAWSSRVDGVWSYPTAPGCGRPYPDRNPKALPTLLVPPGELSVGQRWESRGVHGEIVALDVPVTVPAGSYDCVHVRLTNTKGTEELWLARGKGIIRWKTPDRRTLELVEFTPGNDDPFSKPFFTGEEGPNDVVNRLTWSANGNSYPVTVFRSSDWGWTACWIQIQVGRCTISGTSYQGTQVPEPRIDGDLLHWRGVTLRIGSRPREFYVGDESTVLEVPPGHSFHSWFFNEDGLSWGGASSF